MDGNDRLALSALNDDMRATLPQLDATSAAKDPEQVLPGHDLRIGVARYLSSDLTDATHTRRSRSALNAKA